MDTTYLKVAGGWRYLYRATDKIAACVNIYLSYAPDQDVAEYFLTQAAKTSGAYPEMMTTDKDPVLYQLIKNIFVDHADHRNNKLINNRLEKNHRGIKSRHKPMKGFKDALCADFRIFIIFL